MIWAPVTLTSSSVELMNKDQIVGILKMEYLAMSGNMYLAVRFPGVVFAAVFLQITWYYSLVFQLHACKISNTLKRPLHGQ